MISQLHFRLLTYETKRIDQTWGTLEHCDPYWRLYVNQHSGAYLEIFDGQYFIEPNRIHLIPAWVRLRCQNTKPLNHFYVHFDLIGLAGQVVRNIFTRPRCLPREVRYEQVAKPLIDAAHSPDAPSLAVTMSVKSIVIQAMRDLFYELPQEQVEALDQLATGDHQFDSLVQYIDRHLSDRLDNQRLAEVSNMSKSHFIRRFHKAIGQTPAMYVLERRIARTAERLSFTNDSIERISEETGFSNRFYFTKVFKKIMGIPPVKYRKAVR